jgi:hypothetical protein
MTAPNGGAARGQAHREVLVVAAALHRRGEDRADGCGIGRAAARHSGEEHPHHDVDVREPAPQMADQRHRQLHQPFRDAAMGHHVAGQKEERQGEQGEGVDAVEHLLDHDRGRQALQPDHQERGEQQREPDRHARDQRQGQRKDEQP